MFVFLVILIFAFLVEALWERLQDGVPAKYLPPWLKVWGAVAIAVALCIFYRVDLVAAVLALVAEMAAELGVHLGMLLGYTIVGAIITGIVISRGADGTHKLIVSLFAYLDFKKQGFYDTLNVYGRPDGGGGGPVG